MWLFSDWPTDSGAGWLTDWPTCADSWTGILILYWFKCWMTDNSLTDLVIQELRVLCRILYSHCFAPYRCNTLHAPVQKEAFAAAIFLHVERWHLREVKVKIHKVIQYDGHISTYQKCCRALSDCSVNLWSPNKLFISSTKTKNRCRYIAKATNRRYFTQWFTQKLVLLLISQLNHLDSHKTYYFLTPVTSVTGSGFDWEPWELADW